MSDEMEMFAAAYQDCQHDVAEMTIDTVFQHDPTQQNEYEQCIIAMESAGDVSYSLEMDAATHAPQEEISHEMFGGTFHDATREFGEQQPEVVGEDENPHSSLLMNVANPQYIQQNYNIGQNLFEVYSTLGHRRLNDGERVEFVEAWLNMLRSFSSNTELFMEKMRENSALETFFFWMDDVAIKFMRMGLVSYNPMNDEPPPRQRQVRPRQRANSDDGRRILEQWCEEIEDDDVLHQLIQVHGQLKIDHETLEKAPVEDVKNYMCEAMKDESNVTKLIWIQHLKIGFAAMVLRAKAQKESFKIDHYLELYLKDFPKVRESNGKMESYKLDTLRKLSADAAFISAYPRFVSVKQISISRIREHRTDIEAFFKVNSDLSAQWLSFWKRETEAHPERIRANRAEMSDDDEIVPMEE